MAEVSLAVPLLAESSEGSPSQQSFSSPRKAPPDPLDIRYVKFEIPGIKGAKQLIFIPETCQLASQLPHIMKRLKLRNPTLLIEGMGDTTHPRAILTATEIKDPEYKAMLDSTGCIDTPRDLDSEISKAFANKLEQIFIAVITAADQTQSWLMGQNFGNKTVQQFYYEAQKASPASFWVWTHNAHCVRLTDLDKRLNKFLFENACKFNEQSVKSAAVVPVSEELTRHWCHWDFETPYTGLIRSSHEEYGTRPEMMSSWCFPHSNLIFMQYRQTEDGGFDIDHVDQAEYRNILPDRSLIAPPGCIFIGGRTANVKHRIVGSIRLAIPSILINHTGGYTRLYCLLLGVLLGIIESDVDICKRFLPKKSPDDIKERMQAVNCSKLLQYVLEQGYGNEPDFSYDGTRLALADVRQIVDQAAQRPKVIVDTVKVVDPLKMGADDALEVLSSCFSSTETGSLELGMGNSNTTVVMEAWQQFWQLHKKAKSLRGSSQGHTRFAMFFAFIAVLTSVLHDKFTACPKEGGQGDENWEPYCKMANSFTIGVLGFLTTVAPISSTFVSTVKSHYGHQKKWAATKIAECQLVQQIYLYRGSAGPYSTEVRSSPSAKDGSDEDKGASEDEAAMADPSKTADRQKGARRRARDLFVKTIHDIYGAVQTSELSEDYLGSLTDRRSDLELLQGIEGALYDDFKFSVEQGAGEDVKKDAAASSGNGFFARLFCCCAAAASKAKPAKSKETKKKKKKDDEERSKLPKRSKSSSGSRTSEADEEMGRSSGSKSSGGKKSSLAPVPEGACAEDSNKLHLLQVRLNQLYVEPLTADTYFNDRLTKLVDFSTHIVPTLVKEHDHSQIFIFVCGAISSLLGALGLAGWIPVFMSLQSVVDSVKTFNGNDVRTMKLNQSLAGLNKLKTKWYSMNNLDRRTPETRRKFIEQSEGLVLESMKGWTGGNVKESEPQEEHEGGEDKDSGKGKQSRPGKK